MRVTRRQLIQKSAVGTVALAAPTIILSTPSKATGMIRSSTGFATAQDWRNQYETRWGRIGSQTNADIGSIIHAKNGVYDDQYGPFAWIIHYWLRAWVKMADLTGDEKYLVMAQSYIDYMFDHTDERRIARGEIKENYLREPMGLQGTGKGGPFWKRWEEVNALNTGMIAHGIMRYCDVVLENRDRWPAYALKAEEYIRGVKRAVDAFDTDWKNTGKGGTYYYRDSGGTNVLGNTTVSFNQAATMCAAQLYLDKWDKSSARREKASRLCQFWVDEYARMKGDGTVHWAYRINSDNRGDDIEDTGHASVDLDFLTLSYELGVSEIEEKHIKALTATFKQNIWRKDGSLNEFVDGTTSKGYDEHYNAAFGWFELSKHDPEIIQMALKTYHKHYPSTAKSGQIWARPMLGWVNLLKATTKNR